MNFWSKIKYFSPYEFNSPDDFNSGLLMKKEFIEKLDKIREMCGFVFIVNSGYRTFNWNSKIGGKENSAHLRGFASDINISGDSKKRYNIVKYSIENGINRMVIYKNFIHLDCDPDLPQDIIVYGGY